MKPWGNNSLTVSTKQFNLNIEKPMDISLILTTEISISLIVKENSK